MTSEARSLRFHGRLAFLVTLMWLLACGGDAPPPAVDDPGDDKLEWLADLPSAPAPEDGARVWAAVPRPDGSVLVGAFEVAAAQDGFELVDGVGNRFTGVPPALIRPLRGAEVSAGDLVMTQLTGSGLAVARASDAAGEVEVAWNGRPATVPAAAVEKLDPASEDAFRPIAYRDAVGWQRGWLLASAADQAWVLGADGSVSVADGAQLHGLELGGELAAGSEVMALRWADGYRPGRIVEPGPSDLFYRVQLEGEQAAGLFSVADLVPRPAPWAGES